VIGADRRSLLALVAAVTLIARRAPAQSAGGAATVAEALFRDGVAAFDAGRTAEACDKFAESFRLDPANGTLLNVALCHERQGKTASAWAELSQLAGRAAQAGQKEREQLARTRAAALERRLSRVQIEVGPDAAVEEVRVDGHVLGRAAWGSPLPLDPGEHAFAFAAPGRDGALLHVLVEREATTKVVAPALAMAAPAVVSATPRDGTDARAPGPGNTGGAGEAGQAQGHGTRRALAFVAGGAGIVALGAGTYFGLRTLAKKSDGDAHCAGRLCDDAGLALQEQAHASAAASTVAFGVGLASVVAFAVLYFTSSPVEEAPTRAALRVVPSVGPGAGAVRVEAAW
jgi:hypothetical protein